MSNISAIFMSRTSLQIITNKKLWKESFKSDGQQFHQYQQNEQWPLTSTHWNYKKKKTTTFHVRDPGPGFGQPQKCGGNVGNRWHWGVSIDSYVDYHKEKDKKFLL